MNQLSLMYCNCGTAQKSPGESLLRIHVIGFHLSFAMRKLLPTYKSLSSFLLNIFTILNHHSVRYVQKRIK